MQAATKDSAAAASNAEADKPEATNPFRECELKYKQRFREGKKKKRLLPTDYSAVIDFRDLSRNSEENMRMLVEVRLMF